MDTIHIELRVISKFHEREDTFKIHLQESIETFRTAFEEIFGHTISYDHIKVINRAFNGYMIQSIESLDHDGPDDGTEGLEMEFSDYRDVYNLEDVPEFPFRHLDTIYRYSNKERAIEYNIHGSIILEIEWNADNEPRIVQENNFDTLHVPRGLTDIVDQIYLKSVPERISFQ